VVIYAHHTNAAGIYPRRGDETGNARRHGYLRGWMKTDDRGRYRFSTIRPASYPDQTTPAHIHMTVLEPEGEEYSVEDIMFEGDPLLPPPEQRTGRGGPGVITLVRGQDGGWTGVRDIVLER
jgi:protocatechuate 3,4-dioxygenase beta subunit